MLGTREAGENHNFALKFFFLSAEKFRRGILQCLINFGYRKILCFGGLCHYFRFSVEIFFVSVPKNFVGEPFSVSLISGIENFYASEGYVTIFDFLSIFFCLTVPKNFVGESFSVSLISGIEKC